MPRSAIDDLLKSKGFHQFVKAREAENRLGVAVIERIDAVTTNIGKLGEVIVKMVNAIGGRRK